MKTGKVEYAPDYKSKRRTLTIAADIPDDVDDRLLFCDSTQERIADLQRLRSAVVEAAKEATLDAKHPSVEIPVLPNGLQDAVDALIAFEAEHKIGE